MAGDPVSIKIGTWQGRLISAFLFKESELKHRAFQYSRWSETFCLCFLLCRRCADDTPSGF